MVAELNATLIPLTPREFQFQLTVEQMAEPALTMFVARDETGRACRHGRRSRIMAAGSAR